MSIAQQSEVMHRVIQLCCGQEKSKRNIWCGADLSDPADGLPWTLESDREQLRSDAQNDQLIAPRLSGAGSFGE
jgi:hypothetical protein